MYIEMYKQQLEVQDSENSLICNIFVHTDEYKIKYILYILYICSIVLLQFTN